ncbi:hypothetical protein EV384_4630 [Micromonospora kangleipakensis]|uniref:Uncharacterized protein n=1 Tax=Micromonospora kangleipakensis TaxID=1077942 RepID=A0A4Q8BFJ1_9ACTN|nr:hypothetical protein [Micromonospora kangleipakensis]RZU76033.1 hypothetical protein EV384_4630 [Micromonospora kangleipakensis]
MVLDDDIGKRLFRPIQRRDRHGNPLPPPSDEMLKLIITKMDEFPDWGPKRILAAIRRQRHDVSEELIRDVLAALRPANFPR